MKDKVIGNSDLVRPIHREIYDKGLSEAKRLTFNGYVPLVIERLKSQDIVAEANEVYSVIRGNRVSWNFLNAIRFVVGLAEIKDLNLIKVEEIVEDLKLQKVG
jgi:hypothetical protein